MAFITVKGVCLHNGVSIVPISKEGTDFKEVSDSKEKADRVFKKRQKANLSEISLAVYVKKLQKGGRENSIDLTNEGVTVTEQDFTDQELRRLKRICEAQKVLIWENAF